MSETNKTPDWAAVIDSPAYAMFRDTATPESLLRAMESWADSDDIGRSFFAAHLSWLTVVGLRDVSTRLAALQPEIVQMARLEGRVANSGLAALTATQEILRQLTPIADIAKDTASAAEQSVQIGKQQVRTLRKVQEAIVDLVEAMSEDEDDGQPETEGGEEGETEESEEGEEGEE
jgi:hypothetical protein